MKARNQLLLKGEDCKVSDSKGVYFAEHAIWSSKGSTSRKQVGKDKARNEHSKV